MFKNKFLLVLLFIFLLSISAASAHENTADDILSISYPTTLESADSGDFTELNNKISEIAAGGSLTLEKDYAYSSNDSDYKNGIKITADNVVIDGAGHSIDAAGQARIFDIASNNVTLKNIIFVNGYTSENGGAISSISNLNILDSTFENNTAAKSGGAVYVENSSMNSKIDSEFINNKANNGGAIYFNDAVTSTTVKGHFEGNEAERAGGAIYVRGKSENNIFSSEFYNNSAKQASGGGIFFYKSAENNIFECNFRYNNAIYGGGIFIYSKANNNRFDSEFNSNVAQSCGGAIFFYNTTNNNKFNGNYINNSALGKVDEINGNGGAITFKDTSSNSIFNGDFIYNNATKNGGGVNYRQNAYNITFNSNFMYNSGPNGGGVNFFESFENITFNGAFISNHADNGGAMAFKNGVVEHVTFIDNTAQKGGAIFANESAVINDCKFMNNTANSGSAVYDNGDYLSISNSELIDNRADAQSLSLDAVKTDQFNQYFKTEFKGEDNLLNAIFADYNVNVELTDVSYWGYEGKMNTGKDTVSPVDSADASESGNLVYRDSREARIFLTVSIYDMNGNFIRNSSGYTDIYGNSNVSSKLEPGSYYAQAIHEEDSYYTNISSNRINFTIDKLDTEIKNDTGVEGKAGDKTDISIEITDEFGNPVENGTATLTIDGRKYTTEVVNGIATFKNVILPNKDSVAEVTYQSNNLYNGCSAILFIKITPNDSNTSENMSIDKISSKVSESEATGNPILVLLLVTCIIGACGVIKRK